MLEGGQLSVPLTRETGGYHAGLIQAGAGDEYQLRLGDLPTLRPDPVSRYQPRGPHGPSEIVDPATFKWTDPSWTGVTPTGQVLYELHVGTFTPAGTYEAAVPHLERLADLGITVIELMPLAEFAGRFGWGYDGVDLFAPSHLYGRPDDLRRFVDRAHGVGMGVILDVVYNHLGPEGNYLRDFSPAYFSDRYPNEWGDALNFDGPLSAPVRELFLANARYWIEEFHMDGLRLDATQQVFDASDDYILSAVARVVRESAAGRHTYIVAENEPQHTRFVRPPQHGGYGIDALWNDDFHHSAMVAVTGRAEAYYSDTRGAAQEFIACAKYGYLFQGQHYYWQGKPRGTAGLDLPPACFVNYLQNHDQVANSVHGKRGHQLTGPAEWRAMTALWLLSPGTPLFFQGQEYGASTPFLYFAEFDANLNTAVRRGRAAFLRQFTSVADAERRGRRADPADPTTFERCWLDHDERHRGDHAGLYALHRDLLRLRRQLPQLQRQRRGDCDGAVLGPAAFVLRFLDEDPALHRLLVLNLGPMLTRRSVAEPLVAPPDGMQWTMHWSSEDIAYGGEGTPDVMGPEGWQLPGRVALLFVPVMGPPGGRPEAGKGNS